MSASSHDPALAVDIGGTSPRLGLINLEGLLIGAIARYDVPFSGDGAADVGGILAILAEHVERARQIVSGGLKIGVSLCGSVDLASGDAILAPNLPRRNLPFGKLVSRRFQLPVCDKRSWRKRYRASA